MEGIIAVDDKRLDRMESKIDKVVDALQALVRLEEKHINLEARMSRSEDRLDNHGLRITEAEKELRSRGAVSGRVERFAWLILAALIGSIGLLL